MDNYWGEGADPPDLKIFLRHCSGVDDGITFAWRLFEGEQQKTCCYETKQNINVLYCLTIYIWVMYCKVRPICSIRISLIIAIFIMRKYSSITALKLLLLAFTTAHLDTTNSEIKITYRKDPLSPFSENKNACKKSQVQQLLMKLKSHSYFVWILKKFRKHVFVYLFEIAWSFFFAAFLSRNICAGLELSRLGRQQHLQSGQQCT